MFEHHALGIRIERHLLTQTRVGRVAPQRRVGQCREGSGGLQEGDVLHHAVVRGGVEVRRFAEEGRAPGHLLQHGMCNVGVEIGAVSVQAPETHQHPDPGDDGVIVAHVAEVGAQTALERGEAEDRLPGLGEVGLVAAELVGAQQRVRHHHRRHAQRTAGRAAVVVAGIEGQGDAALFAGGQFDVAFADGRSLAQCRVVREAGSQALRLAFQCQQPRVGRRASKRVERGAVQRQSGHAVVLPHGQPDRHQHQQRRKHEPGEDDPDRGQPTHRLCSQVRGAAAIAPASSESTPSRRSSPDAPAGGCAARCR